jgi:hypothetical protein
VPGRQSTTASPWLVTPRNTHLMVTCHATGVTKPVDRLELSTVVAPPTLNPVPTSVCSVLTGPYWCHAMEECKALQSNNMWDLVSRPPGHEKKGVEKRSLPRVEALSEGFARRLGA